MRLILPVRSGPRRWEWRGGRSKSNARFVMIRFIPSLALFLMAGVSTLRADSTQLDLGYRQMYNLQFDDAHRTFQEWDRQHPEDPMGPVSQAAAYLFAEFDRLKILQSEFFSN